MSHFTLRAAVAVLVFAIVSMTRALAQGPPPPPGGPLPGLTSAELAAFNDGLTAFTQRFGPAAGLGPIFNDDSCVVCHGGAPGGPPPGSAIRAP